MVIIIGAGPAGIATSACLNNLSIPNIVLEREDCSASIWRKKTYDRLRLQFSKQLCQLPNMPFPDEYPQYVPKELFIQYLDDYISHFNVKPLLNRSVESATYDQVSKKWCIKVKSTTSGEHEEYVDNFLVVATGGYSEPYIPKIDGLDTFRGNTMHSTEYKSGQIYRHKNVLVVGSGNSGMEIAFDLSSYGANTSIVVRSPMLVQNRRVLNIGLFLMKYFPANLVDWFLLVVNKLIYGDLTKYGIQMPKEGPLYGFIVYRKIPVVDVGTIEKIKSGEIQVLPSLTSIKGNVVEFADGNSHPFDAIVFATGFKRSTNKWLKNDDHLDEDGRPKLPYPNHWKGKNGFYCAGLSQRGLRVIAADALNIANDIKNLL